ncbi:MAG: hypothetical protein IH987_20240, partial [Planctomycetes bacterium]|nr:hypothetical protein [Planctomycetota bacterium]
MELYIDETKVDIDLPASEPLENVLRHSQTKLFEAGRLVIGLRCDGNEVPADEMADTLKRQASSFERLDVVTGTKYDLVADAMDQAAVSLTQTEEACQQIADGLTEGKTSESMQALNDCLSVWKQIHEAIGKSITMLEIDPQTTLVGGEPMVAVVNKPMGVLLRVKEALQSQDHVLLADTLKYEFSEVAQQWQDVIASI